MIGILYGYFYKRTAHSPEVRIRCIYNLKVTHKALTVWIFIKLLTNCLAES